MIDSLGWDAAWQAAAAAIDPARPPARIVVEHRGAYQAIGEGGERWAELPGKTYFDAGDRRDLPTVGDWVLLEERDHGPALIRAILPRRGLLARRATLERSLPQPIAANIDVGFIVLAADAPAVRALDRYLAIVAEGNARAVVVLNKADLVADLAAVVREIEAGHPGVEVVAARSLTGEVAAVSRALGGGTGVLLGSSGVGKSTLLNALVGEARQATTSVRTRDRKGRHTTTRRELFVLPAGGVVIDTPGMRELALWSEEEDQAMLVELTALAASCRFADCKHKSEPGCAVKAALDAGALDEARYTSYLRLAGDLASDQARRTSATRRPDRRPGAAPPRKKPSRDDG